MKTTATACTRQSCAGCEIEGQLLCLHRPADLADFVLPVLGWFIPFLVGMVSGKFWVGLGIWFGLAAIFFGYVEALILCHHCPHYAEPGSTLSCHANWGLPKIPRFDPRPLSRLEQVAWIVYVLVLFGLYPLPFFILGRQWLLLGIWAWGTVNAAWTVWRTQCNRCYNLSCPVNRVPEHVQEVFFRHYPDFARAWGQSTDLG